MFKVAQIAERLNCSESTVYQLIETGTLRLARHDPLPYGRQTDTMDKSNDYYSVP
jgi:hypothetical protein